MTRELDDLILDLRTNELELGTWVLRTEGDPQRVLAYDRLLTGSAGDWLVNEIILYLRRTLKRLDVTSRSLIALIEPGSCFAGSLLELALAADRSYMLAGVFEDGAVSDPATPPSASPDPAIPPRDPDAVPAVVMVNEMNTGPLSMGNGLTRLQARFFGDPEGLAAVEKRAGEPLDAEDAAELGLVTFTPDDLDWDEEVRIAVEERASFSPDALTGLEANYRFASRNHGDQDLRAAVRLAELDLHAAERVRPRRRAAEVRYWPARQLRQDASVTPRSQRHWEPT